MKKQKQLSVQQIQIGGASIEVESRQGQRADDSKTHKTDMRRVQQKHQNYILNNYMQQQQMQNIRDLINNQKSAGGAGIKSLSIHQIMGAQRKNNNMPMTIDNNKYVNMSTNKTRNPAN